MIIGVKMLLAYRVVLISVLVAETALASRPDTEGAQTTIADAIATPVTALGRNACLTGVVTWRFNNELVIQDETAGIWVAVGKARRTQLLTIDPADLDAIIAGKRLEVRGAVEPGGFAPFIVPTSLRVVGAAALPAAERAIPKDFFKGLYDCRRVEMSGKVRSWTEQPNYWVLNSDSAGRRFTVEIPKTLLASDPTQYENMLVTARGVVTTIFNTRGELIHPNIKVMSLADLSPAPDVAERESRPALTPLPNIARFRPKGGESDTIRTRGLVTHASPGKFVYLQDGVHGILVECPAMPALRRGDRVEAVGQFDRRSAVAGILDGSIQVIGHETPPPALALSPSTIVANNTEAALRSQRAEPSDYYGVLIRFTARVFDVQRTETGGSLLLDADGCTVSARLNRSTFGHLASLSPDTTIAVTGIVIAPDVPASRLNRPSPAEGDRFLQLLVRGPDDVSTVAKPSWWTAPRLFALLAVVACCGLAAAAWGMLLRRMVGRQAMQLESNVRSQTLLTERLRIARDLHDTMEQDLACLMMRLDAEASLMADERSMRSLHQIRRCMAQIQADAHDFLWDLRDPIRVGGNLAASLASQVAYMQSMTDVPITFTALGSIPASVPGSIQHALLRITREAVGNAIRHAAPQRIDVKLTRSETQLGLSITDDGTGFDPSGFGHSEGHYGLAGIRERAERIGAACRIQSGDGRGTDIVVDVPMSPLPA